jgi:hypothetical protein
MYDYIRSGLVVSTFYIWWFISRAIVSPAKYAGACISGVASTVYNFKLPAIALSDLPLVPTLPKPYFQNLPKFNFKNLPSMSLPPFGELPGISHVYQFVTQEINFPTMSLDLWSSFLTTFYSVEESFVWITYTHPLSLLERITDVSTISTTFYFIIRFILNLLFGTRFDAIDQRMASRSIAWNLFFLFRYIVQWVIWPVSICVRGSYALLTIPDTVTKVLLNITWPVLLIMLKRDHPTAIYDLGAMVVMLLIIVSIQLLPSKLSLTRQYN